MNFLEFLQQKQNFQTRKDAVNEAFKASNVDKAHELMLNIFKKKISPKVFGWDWLDTVMDGKEMRSYYFIDLTDGKSKVWSLNYLVDDRTSEVYSISFYDEKTSHDFLWTDKTNFTAKLVISTLGTSVAYFIPIICDVVKNERYNITKEEAKELGYSIFDGEKKNEGYDFNYGAATYKVYEQLTSEDIEDVFYLSQGFTMVEEASQAQEYRWKKKKERDDAYKKMKETGSSIDRENYARIDQEYREIVNVIRGGVSTIDELKMALAKNQKVEVVPTPQEKEAMNAVEEEGKDPKQAFKEMQVYVKTVMKGLQPGVIICGAPGVGKTYKVLQQLKAAGYEDGKNLDIIKGKCTPRHLYLSLFNYSNKGHIILIDDADALVGPHAPEDCINMLKAALDSTSTDQGRKISYRVAGKILDDEGREVPKTCYYNGGVIVITNYSVGQLDTALRGRTFIQSLDFTDKQLLSLIRDMLPNLGQGQLTEKSKKKALDYLQELADSNAQMEISIRTFMTCARLFAVCEDDMDMSDDDVKSMIKEQMANQAIRGGKKF